jgi:fluoride exporter
VLRYASVPGTDAQVCQSGSVSSPSELRTIAVVAVGGVLGSTGRWIVGTQLGGQTPDQIPWPTLTVNIVGCLVIGFINRRIERDTLAWGFMATGLLGGFTTMSAFGVELNELADAGRTGLAAAYLGVTIVAGLAALLIGEIVSNRHEIGVSDNTP